MPVEVGLPLQLGAQLLHQTPTLLVAKRLDGLEASRLTPTPRLVVRLQARHLRRGGRRAALEELLHSTHPLVRLLP